MTPAPIWVATSLAFSANASGSCPWHHAFQKTISMPGLLGVQKDALSSEDDSIAPVEKEPAFCKSRWAHHPGLKMHCALDVQTQGLLLPAPHPKIQLEETVGLLCVLPDLSLCVILKSKPEQRTSVVSADLVLHQRKWKKMMMKIFQLLPR